MRMIDADALHAEISAWPESIMYKDWVQSAIANAPTLVRLGEGGKDKNVPTNGPLTLEELRMMAEPTPVWWDWVQGWVLARKGMITTWNGRYYNSGELRGDFYRRPPLMRCLVMNECRQENCPFRSNSSSSVYGCEHIACPNRDDGSITWIATDHTITDRRNGGAERWEYDRLTPKPWLEGYGSIWTIF